jgi:hypothetical protein
MCKLCKWVRGLTGSAEEIIILNVLAASLPYNKKMSAGEIDAILKDDAKFKALAKAAFDTVDTD